MLERGARLPRTDQLLGVEPLRPLRLEQSFSMHDFESECVKCRINEKLIGISCKTTKRRYKREVGGSIVRNISCIRYITHLGRSLNGNVNSCGRLLRVFSSAFDGGKQ